MTSIRPLGAMLLALAAGGCAQFPAPAPQASLPLPPPQATAGAACVQWGLASWYRPAPGQWLTADGARLATHGLTAAHPFLPFGTRVRVTDLATRRSVTVRIDDRGPFVPGRIIDLSPAAAARLRMRHAGVARVRLLAGRGLAQPGMANAAPPICTQAIAASLTTARGAPPAQLMAGRN